MPHSITWLIENQLMFINFSGAITAEEVIDLAQKTPGLINASPLSNVHVILDVATATQMPALVETVKHVRTVKSPPKLIWTIIVMSNPSVLVRWVSDTAVQMLGIRYRRVASLEEAIALMRTLDDSLQWELLPEAYRMEG